MAQVPVQLDPEAAAFLGSTFPQLVKNLGTNFPVFGLAFDAATDEAAFWMVHPYDYVSGSITIDLEWYADTATSGVVRWEAALAAITPDTDTQDVETKAFATAVTVDDTHLGTTGQRLHRASITITTANQDSLAARDDLWVRIRRIGSNAADTMAGDAILVAAILQYPNA